MALTIVETRAITGGVDTHADVHVAAALDPIGGLLGVKEFRPPGPATPVFSAGWAVSGPSAWSGSKGPAVTAPPDPPCHHSRGPCRRGRPVRSPGPPAAGQVRPAGCGQRRPGRPVRAGPRRAEGAGRHRRGNPCADGRQAQRHGGTHPDDQPGQSPGSTGPDDLRARFAKHTAAALVAAAASLRPRPGDVVGYAVRVALRELGRRAEFPGGQLERPGELIVPLVTAHAPGLLALYGIGPNTAALLLIAAGDHPERLRSEAAWAHLCAAAPIPASSGKTVRHRLNPGGDRQANHALWRIVFTRMGSDPATRAYAGRRTAEGKSKAEIIRCLKRYVAREVYPHLRHSAG